MSGFAEYDRHDGLGLADLVRRREVTPRDLVEEAIARIERVQPQLNAVVSRLFEAARSAAEHVLPEGPFTGVPLLLKDLLALVAGAPISFGSRFLADYRPATDSEIVRRLKAAGFIPVAKTNTPEFGLMPVTEPDYWGAARNPWDLTRTPGGSSGGSAAAVAAGIVPIANGGDGGGSLRIPASCCGLFGLKPTRARTPTGPDQVEIWQGFAVEHGLTRSVRDSAALLDALSGPEPGAIYAAPVPARPFVQEVGAPTGRLRIAFTAQPLVPARSVHADCVAALDDAVRLCTSLGHEVVEARPDVDGAAFSRDFVRFLIGETAAEVRDAEALIGRRARVGDIEPATAVLRLLGEHTSAAEFAHALRRLKRVALPVAGFFEKYDLLLTPTLAQPPLPIGTLQPKGGERALMTTLARCGAGRLLKWLGAIDRIAENAWTFIPYTTLFNVTGQPAMSVPLFWNAANVPIGVQFVGRFGDEATLFRLAGQLEQARPWRDRRPPVHAGAATSVAK